MRVSPALLIIAAVVLVAPSLSVARINEQPHPDAIVSHIRRERVESTAIATIGYSKRLHALEIEFLNGAIYRYLDVPTPLYRELMASDSKARFYHKNVRGKYRSIHVKPRKKKK